MLLSEWRKTAPNRECMSNKVLAVLKPVLANLGADGDPACWVIWGEDPEFRYSVMAPTPAGLVSVAVRLGGGAGGDGNPRATGKLVRWGKLQLSELGVEAADGHRIVAVQVEGQVIKGTDDEADRICEFLLGLMAGIDGRAFVVASPVIVQAVPQVVPQAVPITKPIAVKPESQPEAPKAPVKPGLKSVPTPAAASPAAAEPVAEAGEVRPPAAEQPPARKPAKTPGGKTRAWVAPHPIGLPAPAQPPSAQPSTLQPPPAKPSAPKPPVAPPAQPAAARAPEPGEGAAVWEVPEPSEREAKRPRTWTP